MVRPEFNTSTNIYTVGLMLWMTIDLWSKEKAVMLYRYFCVIKLMLEMSNRGVYDISLIKIDNNGQGGFMAT